MDGMGGYTLMILLCLLVLDMFTKGVLLPKALLILSMLVGLRFANIWHLVKTILL